MLQAGTQPLANVTTNPQPCALDRLLIFLRLLDTGRQSFPKMLAADDGGHSSSPQSLLYLAAVMKPDCQMLHLQAKTLDSGHLSADILKENSSEGKGEAKGHCQNTCNQVCTGRRKRGRVGKQGKD